MGNITNTVDSSWQAAGVMLQGTEKRGRKNKSKQIFTVVYISGGRTIVVSGVEGHDSLRHDPAGIHCELWDSLKDIAHVYRRVFTRSLHSSGDRKHQQSISDHALNARYEIERAI